MLSCKQITEIVTDYLEGRMGLGDRLGFQMHLGMCKHCRAYVRQMKATIAVLGTIEAEPMPQDVLVDMRKRFAAWHAARGKGSEKKSNPV